VGKLKWRSFEEARTFVHQLDLKSKNEWVGWTKSGAKPDDIPANPARNYKEDGWISWGDWLGTGTVAPQDRKYRPFKEARDFVHQFNLQSKTEWADWTKSDAKPDDIPANPARNYKAEGWIGWGDWLGTGTIAPQNREYLPFKESRTFVHQLQLKNSQEWINWVKSDAKPIDIPAYPEGVYKDKGWIGWGDWLGTGVIATFDRKYLPFIEARSFVHQLQLKKQKEWQSWSKSIAKPDDIPADPRSAYKEKGWIDYGDWLGTGSIATQNRKYLPFKEVREFVINFSCKVKKNGSLGQKVMQN